MVGEADEDGCQCVLRTSDQMGNDCIEGGANVRVVAGNVKIDLQTGEVAAAKTKSKDRSEDTPIETDVLDHGDGTYRLRWRSKFSGTFKTRVLIDNEDVLGSPTTFRCGRALSRRLQPLPTSRSHQTAHAHTHNHT